jgi:hypothetical protein
MQVSAHLKSTPAFRSIPFLCEGNHRRNPNAGAVLQLALDDRINVESAGFDALVGCAADPEAQRLMTEMVPRAPRRVILLGHFLPSPFREIREPLRQDPDPFRLVFEIIEHSVTSWLPCMFSDLRSA